MKPIKLILKNVGPYLDEKIDFTSLDNMFLIAGNTGSGKTSAPIPSAPPESSGSHPGPAHRRYSA